MLARALILALALSYGQLTWASGEPESVESTTGKKESSKSSLSAELSLGVPVIYGTVANPPEGMNARHLHPPIQFGIELSTQKGDHVHFAPYLRGDMAFLDWGISPMLGATLGLDLSIGEFLHFYGGAQANFQHTFDKYPFQESVYDTFVGGWVYGAKVAIAVVEISYHGKVLNVDSTTFSKAESLSTVIGHNPTYLYEPGIALRLPFGWRAGISYGIYSLGDTSIASKEFGVTFARKTVYRPKATAVVRLGPLAVIGTYAVVMGVSDSQELAYQAPFVADDYLLASPVGTVEVSWRY